ncbi:MAG: DUF362 domain-containing protein [Candidatus Nealsonbacteria bacterium]|nr:DUF362 domain-containing protein [Candidatus Nealsonbacteria bacterium]
MNKVIKREAKNDVKSAIVDAVDGLGGFSRFINRGDVVLLKPNFNTSDPPPASTDLDFLRAVVELVYDYGAKIVMVGDSSTMSLNTRKVMKELGVFELEKEARPPRIYVFDERKWVKKEIPRAEYLKTVSVTEYLDRADKLIFLPNLKTHFQAQFTGSLKLSVGCMKPLQRVWLHLSHIQEKIAELNTIICPDLVIMDARKCFINGGPAKGKVEQPGLVMASEDRVLVDVEGIKVIQSFRNNSLKGIDPWRLPQIEKSVNLGIGKGKN